MRERHAPSMLVAALAIRELVSCGKLRFFKKIHLYNPYYQILPLASLAEKFVPGITWNVSYDIFFRKIWIATSQPPPEGVKMIGRLWGCGNLRLIWFWGRNTSDYRISNNLVCSTRKVSVAFWSSECGMKLLIIAVDTPSLEDNVGLFKAESLSSVGIVCIQVLSGSNWSRILRWFYFGNAHCNKMSK